MAISIEDVRAAYFGLKKDGERLTVANVRARLRGGSFNTLGPLVRAVKDEDSSLESESGLNIEENVPGEVIERIVEAAKAAGAEAFMAIAEPLERKIRDAKSYLASERAAMRADMDQVLAESRDSCDRAEALQADLGRAREMLAAKSVELSLANEKVQRAEDRHKIELDLQFAQIVSLQGDLKAAQSKLEGVLVEMGELRGLLLAESAKRSGRKETATTSGGPT